MPKKKAPTTIGRAINKRLEQIEDSTEAPPMHQAQEQGVDYSASLHKPSASKEEVDSRMKTLLEDLERRKRWEKENGLR